MGGAETTSTVKLACVLVSHLEEKVKVSGSSLSLGETDVFHKPRNHELIFVGKKLYFFLTLLNGEMKPQAFGIDGLQNT